MVDALSETVVQETPGTMVLQVIQGKDMGTKFALAEGRAMVIGRMTDSDIRIDPSDKLVSRHHARITRQGEAALLEDLESGNGTFVGDVKISKQLLQAGAVFRIGGTTFVLEVQQPVEKTNVTMYLESEKAVKKGGSKVRILLLGLLLVCLLFFVFILFSGGKEEQNPQKKPAVVEQAEDAQTPGEAGPDTQPSGAAQQVPAASASDAPATAPVTAPAASSESASSGRTSPENAPAAFVESQSAATGVQKKESQDHFRQGRFFYNTGNLEKAVDEWDRACSLDPENEAAKKWLLRAERELDEQIDIHYRRGLKAKKYMRYTDAINEFKLVVKWSRNTQDKRYLDAQKQLEELKDN